MKPKKCRICKGTFTPFRPFMVCCSAGCAIEKAQKDRARKEARDALESRRAHRAEKVKAKPRSYWMKIAQAAFNAYIRTRDEGKPCISCGSLTGKKNAGHYRSVGSAPELRFEPLNCHLQCEKCNSYLSGNLINYRINLIKLIGLGVVEWIEGKHEPMKYTIQDLQEIRATFIKQAKLWKQN